MANEYHETLRNFIGKTVEIATPEGKHYQGKCKAIGYDHLNVVIECPNGLTVLKNIISIRELKNAKSNDTK